MPQMTELELRAYRAAVKQIESLPLPAAFKSAFRAEAAKQERQLSPRFSFELPEMPHFNFNMLGALDAGFDAVDDRASELLGFDKFDATFLCRIGGADCRDEYSRIVRELASEGALTTEQANQLCEIFSASARQYIAANGVPHRAEPCMTDGDR